MKTLLQKALPALVLGSALLAMTANAQEAGPRDGAPGGGGRGGFAGMQRVAGTVTAISGDAITVKGEDGSVLQVTTTTNTRVMKGSGQGAQPATIKVADLKVGDGLMAMGNLDAPNKTLHAAVVMATDAEQVKKMRENLGKTYIAGRVTAIDVDNLKITVLRQDGVSQVIGLDDSTSFKRGRGGRGGGGMMGLGSGGGTQAGADSGESITLADVKTGDTVAGTGSIKSGTFVPGQLLVMAPRAPREGRGGGAPPAAKPQP